MATKVAIVIPVAAAAKGEPGHGAGVFQRGGGVPRDGVGRTRATFVPQSAGLVPEGTGARSFQGGFHPEPGGTDPDV